MLSRVSTRWVCGFPTRCFKQRDVSHAFTPFTDSWRPRHYVHYSDGERDVIPKPE